MPWCTIIPYYLRKRTLLYSRQYFLCLCQCVRHIYSDPTVHTNSTMNTVFPRSDAATATINFVRDFVRCLFEGGIYSFTAPLSGAVLAHSPFIDPKSGEQLLIFNVFDSLQPKRCFKSTPLTTSRGITMCVCAFSRCGYNSRVATINTSLRHVVGHLFEGGYCSKYGVYSRKYSIIAECYSLSC